MYTISSSSPQTPRREFELIKDTNAEKTIALTNSLFNRKFIAKLSLFELTCISRNYLSKEQNIDNRKQVVDALTKMADKAEAKYSGFMGTIRKTVSFICNLFKSTRSVQFLFIRERLIGLFSDILFPSPLQNIQIPENSLYGKNLKDKGVHILSPAEISFTDLFSDILFANPDVKLAPDTNDNLPFFVGTDANFARLVAQCYTLPSKSEGKEEDKSVDSDIRSLD